MEKREVPKSKFEASNPQLMPGPAQLGGNDGKKGHT